MRRALPSLSVLLLTACATTEAIVLDPEAAREARAASAIQWPELSEATLERWLEHVQPNDGELATDSIDWIPEFAEGIRESARQGRPLLFWAMNGHPLGCT